MKITRPGKPPETVAIHVDCLYCGAGIEFLPKEVERISDQRDGDYYSFKCPCCGQNVTKNVRANYMDRY